MSDTPGWPEVMMDIAQAISRKSKDASTKVGAALMNSDKTVASMGFNGFPRRIPDNPLYLNDPKYRAKKLARIVHAEANCLRLNKTGSTEGYQLFVTRHPCDKCALEICCSDITDVWFLTNEDYETRWAESVEEARELLDEAGIRVHRMDP